jgi:hypothetical protein
VLEMYAADGWNVWWMIILNDLKAEFLVVAIDIGRFYD